MNARALAIVSLFVFAGCRTVHVLGPGQLQKFDGFDASNAQQAPPQLEMTSGEVISFTPNHALAFVRPASTERAGHIQLMTVRPDRVVATLAGGRPFSIDLGSVTEVWLLGPAPVRTTLLVIGSILLGGAAVIGAGALAATHSFSRGGGGLGP